MPRPAARLLPVLILGASLLTACSEKSSATLVADAKAKLAAGDYKTAMIPLKNALAAEKNNAEAHY